MLKVIRHFLEKEEGASLAEYALFLTLITLVLVASVGVLNTAVQAALNSAAGLINPS